MNIVPMNIQKEGDFLNTLLVKYCIHVTWQCSYVSYLEKCTHLMHTRYIDTFLRQLICASNECNPNFLALKF